MVAQESHVDVSLGRKRFLFLEQSKKKIQVEAKDEGIFLGIKNESEIEARHME